MRSLLLLVALTGGWAEGRPPAHLLYVTNQDDATISVIDMDAKRVVETIDLRKLGFGPTA
jgi:YVTN family beta-propeller protein